MARWWRVDGAWTRGSPASSSGAKGPCPATTAEASVADGKLHGRYVFRNYTYTIEATIAADGTATGHWANNPMKGKFSGTHFDGTYESPLCGGERTIFLDKAG